MEPTDGLGARRPQVVMVIRQQAQDASVVLGHDAAQSLRPQRGDGGGQGVVGVVLLGLARTEHSNPGRQGGRDVDDVFAGGDELLGQQEPEPVGRLDGPASLRKVDRPFEETLDLVTVCLHRQLAECCLFFVDRHRSVGRLVRVDADQHHHVPPCLWWEPRRAILMRPVCSPLSSHAVAKELGG